MVAHEKTIRQQRVRRRFRVRKALRGSAERPRLSVFRSEKHIYCQVIDDVARRTLVSASTRDRGVRGDLRKTADKNAAIEVGKMLAARALNAGIQQVCLDRGSYKYHGRVKALADAAREAGLQF